MDMKVRISRPQRQEGNMVKVIVEKKCECGMELSLHEENEDGELISRSPKCNGFSEGEICVCKHYSSSHDIMGRCHFYVEENDEGDVINMCKCDEYSHLLSQEKKDENS